jgi:hypothetical protein
MGVEHMPKDYQSHAYDGEKEHEYAEPAAKRVWGPRSSSRNLADPRTESNLAVNGESKSNPSGQERGNSQDRQTEIECATSTDYEDDSDEPDDFCTPGQIGMWHRWI